MKRDLGREMRKIAAHLDIEIDEKVFRNLVNAAKFWRDEGSSRLFGPRIGCKTLEKQRGVFFQREKWSVERTLEP